MKTVYEANFDGICFGQRTLPKNESYIHAETLEDIYKIKALSEIWDDLTIEDVEAIVKKFKLGYHRPTVIEMMRRHK